MTHVVTQPNEPFTMAGGALEVHQIPSASDNLIWLLVSKNGEAAAVDGPEAGSVLDYCERRGYRLTTIFNTHTHGDHVGINRDLERRSMLASLRVAGPRRAARDVPGLTEPVDEGDTVEFAGIESKVMLTEGHIDGHVTFVFDGAIFCGDTMFGAGCGYLFDGPPPKMWKSLDRLSALDGSYRVCCAHEYTQDNLRFAWSVEPGNTDLAARIKATWALRAEGRSSVPSTIDIERKTNPFLRHASPVLRQHVAKAMPEWSLATPADIFAATRALKDRKDYRSLPDSALPVT